MLYTVKEVSERLEITVRAVQIKCKTAGIHKKGNTYMIPARILKRWEANEKQTNQTNQTNELPTEGENETIIEHFTPEEYDKLNEVIHQQPELLKRLKEYQQEIKFLREELQERTKQLDIQGNQVSNLIEAINGSIKTLHQSNFLQAKDKGLDK
jgi:uncharacterized coiled-coil DUF342 family protein